MMQMPDGRMIVRSPSSRPSLPRARDRSVGRSIGRAIALAAADCSRVDGRRSLFFFFRAHHRADPPRASSSSPRSNLKSCSSARARTRPRGKGSSSRTSTRAWRSWTPSARRWRVQPPPRLARSRAILDVCLPPSAAIVPLTSLSRDPQGPRGLDKLVHDDKGVTTISNDGATIMKVRREAPISRASRVDAPTDVFRISHASLPPAAASRLAARAFSSDRPTLTSPSSSPSHAAASRHRPPRGEEPRGHREIARLGGARVASRDLSTIHPPRSRAVDRRPLRPSFKKKTEPPTE